ncbi:cyclase family protein [Sorangium atrum]|uniref:Cyclase family protein n=1 Tax=Sorangium atrum TaxID=2995308 RepID=A0ABT5C8Q3_9BACT|nr:cyclase family protein [Sorangium aterium]MDC0682817.1 cyclase family protein [Sorangium aterium]
MRTLISTVILLAAHSAGCAAEQAGARGDTSAGAGASAVRLPEGARLVDLTYPFDDKTIYWPTATTGFAHETVHHGKTEGGYFYSAYTLCAPEHGGTHLDAPIHFAEGKTTADAVPLSRLVGPAVVVDVSAAAARDSDYLVNLADIEAFERAHGAIEPRTIVLIRTGWGARWPDKKRYLGDDRPGHAEALHFPGIGEDAARALVARNVGAVGIDTASIDNGPSKDFITHRVLLGADIPAFENVASMESLPPRGALVIALPMKIRAGSGGPLRIVAVLPR